jgi:hypothetical protein
MTALHEADSRERLEFLREHYTKRNLSPSLIESLDVIYTERLAEDFAEEETDE